MLILLVLLLLSLASLALVVEGAMLLRRHSLMPERFASHVADRLAASDAQGAISACQSQPSVLATVVYSGLLETDQAVEGEGWTAVDEAMQAALDREAARLVRRIDYVSVVGNLAPMLGLLGTVVGMIFAFREVAVTQGAATAADLAAGIYQALVTTVGGLVVAIPSLAAHALLKNRLEAMIEEVVLQAERATSPLKRALAPRRRPPSTAGETNA